jgi:hypothetical protein
MNAQSQRDPYENTSSDEVFVVAKQLPDGAYKGQYYIVDTKDDTRIFAFSQREVGDVSTQTVSYHWQFNGCVKAVLREFPEVPAPKAVPVAHDGIVDRGTEK